MSIMTERRRTRTIDPVELRKAFACFPSGVVGLCALIDDSPVGIAANSFASVSLDPPLASVCVAHTSTTWPVLAAAPRLGVSVLSAEGEQASRQLSAKGIDRFADLMWTATEHGAIYLDQAVLHLDTSIEAQVVAGDHDIVVLRVHDIVARPERGPLVFHGSRYRHLVDDHAAAS